MLKNIMEDIVELKIDDVMDISDICRCKNCRSDVKALALNHLLPRYIARPDGEIFTNVELHSKQGQAEIIYAITSAIEVVRKHPRH